MAFSDHLVTTMEQLQSLYGERNPAAIAKEIDFINGSYSKLIEAAPFVAIATGGPEGLDCSPKGDAPGFVRILDNKTLALPDRPGNNRIDGFRNILRDPRIALLFLIPGIGDLAREWPRLDLGRSGTDAKLCDQRQAAALRAGRSRRKHLLPLLEGDRALEAVGGDDQDRTQEPAVDRYDHCGIEQGTTRRRGI